MMMRRTWIDTVLLLAFCGAQNLAAQKLSAPADAKAKVDQIFAKYGGAGSPGCAVGTSIGRDIVLQSGYGMADLEHNIPITPQTIFEPGSVTKQFTAAAVLLLVEQGKISLDDPVRKYFPELPDYGEPVLKVSHLLNHTSGLRDWGEVAAINGWPRTTRANGQGNVLEIASQQLSLNYPPGAEYSYTNTGYNLAAMLVGRVSGKSIAEFTKEYIFQPLDMSSTSWRDDYRRIVPNRAMAYSNAGGVIRTDMPFEDAHGNGGLLTTVGDLLRWNRNFTELKVGGRKLIELQTEQGVLTSGRKIAYARGLMILHWKGVPEVSHSGSTAGYSAWLGRYPEQELSVAVLCNVTTNATALGHQVADVYLDTVISHPKPRSIAADPASLQPKAGLYRSTRDHHTQAVAFRDGALHLGARTLTPIGANTFSEEANGTEVEFTPGGMRLSTETDPNDMFERVMEAHPSADELSALVGQYNSTEAEIMYRATVENGQLVLHRRTDPAIPLTPTYSDGFSSSIGSIRFLRDRDGRVTQMSIGRPRVWDLRLARQSSTH
jgi:CubicO group peptidase (beta-lactamase class C family)